MAQSPEARLNKQVAEALSRVDFNVHQFASGTTAYHPLVKHRLAELVLSVAHMHHIDWEYGNWTAEDKEAVRVLASLHKYVTGIDSPLADW